MRLDPNPPSPYATADANSRHIFPSHFLLPDPLPGVLAITACEQLAVVPDTTQAIDPDDTPPDGMCLGCITVLRGGQAPADPRALVPCRNHDNGRGIGGMCTLCRIDAHDSHTQEQQRPETT